MRNLRGIAVLVVLLGVLVWVIEKEEPRRDVWTTHDACNDHAAQWCRGMSSGAVPRKDRQAIHRWFQRCAGEYYRRCIHGRGLYEVVDDEEYARTEQAIRTIVDSWKPRRR